MVKSTYINRKKVGTIIQMNVTNLNINCIESLTWVVWYCIVCKL